LIAKVHPSEWESIVWKMFIEANQKNDPPLDEGELRAIFNSITNAEKSNDTERWYQKEETNEDSEVLPFFESASKDASLSMEKFST